MSNPFDLDQAEAYARWRQWKLARTVCDARDLVVGIEDPFDLKTNEKQLLTEKCRDHNMAIYQLADGVSDKALVHELGRQLGLERLDNNLRADEDSVTSLEVRAQDGNQYIPYTSRPLSWHSDGYYNTCFGSTTS